MNLFKYVIAIFVLTISISCTRKKSCLDKYCVLLEDYLITENYGNEFINDLKNNEKDSTFLIRGMMYYPIRNVLKSDKLTIQERDEIENCIANYEVSKDVLIIRAFRKHLIGEDITLSSIAKNLKKTYYLDSLNYIVENKYWNAKKISLAEKNNFESDLGDTLNLIFQLRINEDKKSTYFTESQNFYLADDTLKVKAILTDKIYYDTLSIHSIDNLIFKLRVVELNYSNVFHMNKILNVNDSFILPLLNYATIISK